MSRVQIILSDNILAKAQDLAKRRNGKQALYGAMTHGSVRGSEEAHLIGMLGELAAAQYFKVPVDETVFETHGDNGLDIVTESLGKIQVKTTTYWSEPLLRAEVRKDKTSIDTYVLTYVKLPNETWLIGYLERDEVIKRKKLQLVPWGPLNYIVNENELKSF